MRNSPSRLFPEPRIHVGVLPLVTALATGKAVAYVGAGVSIPAGLPSWPQFLDYCLEQASKDSGGPAEWAFTRKLLANNDFLTAAELLQIGVGSQVEKYVWDVFSSASKPSRIHLALARLPLSMVVTTNYDRLLEIAYRKKPGILTWMEPQAVFCAIRHRRFTIVKTHGDVGNGPSLILTKTQYRDLMHLNGAFNSCLRTLLSLRTFLFVGCSLRDPDLIHLLDETRTSIGNEFGPHYAIIFEDEVDDKFEKYLENCYSIKVIRVKTPPPGCVGREAGEFRAAQVAAVLTELAGRAALIQQENAPGVNLDAPGFSMADACRIHLESALDRTGSIRGDICLVGDDDPVPVRVATIPAQANAREAPRPDSVIGRLFLKQKVDSDYVYIEDTAEATRHLEAQGFSDMEYHVCDTSVRSELAVPVTSDGNRVGVINVESDQTEAYTADHLVVLQRIADQIGWTYYETKQRATLARQIEPFFRTFESFEELVNKSKLLKSIHLDFIVYKINYRLGTFEPLFNRSRHPDVEKYSFRFDETCLPASVLRRRQRVLIPDAENEAACPRPRLSSLFKKFGIRGPIFGVPVQSHGSTSAVLVAWPRLEQLPRKRLGNPDEFVKLLARSVERLTRMTSLLASSPEGADLFQPQGGFITALEAAMKNIDRVSQRPVPAEDGDHVRCILRTLLTKDVGAHRIRLWTPNPDRTRYQISVALASGGATWPDDPAGEDAYLGTSVPVDDPYVKYTLKRFEHDPYSRRQERRMLEQPDTNAHILHKDPEGPWIVCPVVDMDVWCMRQWDQAVLDDARMKPEDESRHTPDMIRAFSRTVELSRETPIALKGFISVDRHLPHDQGPDAKPRYVPRFDPFPQSPGPTEQFQRHAIDIVADLLETVI